QRMRTRAASRTPGRARWDWSDTSTGAVVTVTATPFARSSRRTFLPDERSSTTSFVTARTTCRVTRHEPPLESCTRVTRTVRLPLPAPPSLAEREGGGGGGGSGSTLVPPPDDPP